MNPSRIGNVTLIIMLRNFVSFSAHLPVQLTSALSLLTGTNTLNQQLKKIKKNRNINSESLEEFSIFIQTF